MNFTSQRMWGGALKKTKLINLKDAPVTTPC